MVKDLKRVIDKYERNASAAADEYVAGLKNPKRGPVTGAIANRATLEAKMKQKSTWDKWEANLKAVGDDGVLKAAIDKGSLNYPTGIAAGIPKMRKFLEQFLPHLEAGRSSIDRMQKRTIEESIAKNAAQIRHNAKFSYKK
tara:strand:- start:989 stop:1411 length:423 start_codon:yes stop_codon:yes gene_type:complete